LPRVPGKPPGLPYLGVVKQDTDTGAEERARAQRRRLNRLAETAIAVADEYRARGNHARAKAMDEISSALREIALQGPNG